MGQIIAFRYPVEIILEHNDNVVDTYVDEWGEYDIYKIEKVYWAEKSGQRWEVIVKHPITGQPIRQIITPYQSGSKNIPPPARFNSYPLEINCSFQRD